MKTVLGIVCSFRLVVINIDQFYFCRPVTSISRHFTIFLISGFKEVLVNGFCIITFVIVLPSKFLNSLVLQFSFLATPLNLF